MNDTHGHFAGDTVLKEFRKVILASCKTSDFVSRLGGEEFCILLRNYSLEETIEAAERIRKNIEKHDFIVENDIIIHVTVSIGVSMFPDLISDVNEVLKNADKALYKAKRSGRNRICSNMSLKKLLAP